MKKLKSPNNIHHLAFLCRDAEQTRWFYEDVMGFKLVAALDFESSPGSGEPLEYMHLNTMLRFGPSPFHPIPTI